MLKPNPSEATPSDARTAANRANAQLSTGPRTPEGKARSSLNAMKHGCFSRHLERAAGPLGEDRAEFDALRTGLVAEYQPEGPEETLLVDRMAALWWRMQRLAAQQQTYLAERLKVANPLAALEESEAPTLFEARLDRLLRAARKDLLAHQAWRIGATERRVAARRRRVDAEIADRMLDRQAQEWQATQERLARTRAQQEDRSRALQEDRARAAQAQQEAERAATGEVGPADTPPDGNGAGPGLAPQPRPSAESDG